MFVAIIWRGKQVYLPMIFYTEFQLLKSYLNVTNSNMTPTNDNDDIEKETIKDLHGK